MEQYKQEFIEFMIDCEVLRFGEFTTKSGRQSPFFINTGFYKTGSQLKKLGAFYARAIGETFGTDFDVLFGPAYKGIPLSVATCMEFYELTGKDLRYSANRKEMKDHGDQGIFLGSPVLSGDRVVIIEDVTTAGTSVEETIPILQAAGAKEILGLVVSVDRMERGRGDCSALEELAARFGMKTTAIVSMREVIDHLYNKPYQGQIIIDDRKLDAIRTYYDRYGVQ